MKNLIQGQYLSEDYPLKKFSIKDIPAHILNILKCISNEKLGVIRGGLAFILLTGEFDYMLKDIDILALHKDKNELIKYLASADTIYLNKNIFGNDLITGFWENNGEFFKIDVLLTNNISNIKNCIWGNIEFSTTDSTYLLINKLSKIAQKDIRKHNKSKTLNHYKVALNLSNYLIKNNISIDSRYVEQINSYLIDVELVLTELIDNNELVFFLNQQKSLVHKLLK